MEKFSWFWAEPIPPSVLLLGWILPFTALLAIVALGTRFAFSRLWKKRPWTIGAVLFGVTHFLAVTLVGVALFIGTRQELLSVEGWALLVYADFPISSLLVGGDQLFTFSTQDSMMLFWLNNMVVPYLLFALLGSLQYSVCGALAGQLVEILTRFRRRKGDSFTDMGAGFH